MSDNKTKPTQQSVDDFLSSTNEARRRESKLLIEIMRDISGKKPVMWGPSIIGFGEAHYKYNSGRSGVMPKLSFSPRKVAITIYFDDFNKYSEELLRLGKFKNSVSCLYINKLTDIDIDVLAEMLRKLHDKNYMTDKKVTSVEEYTNNIPLAAKAKFGELRSLVISEIPSANEVLSYGIIGYKTDDKRAKVYISAWKDHLSIYPKPKDADLVARLKPYIRNKSTLCFSLEEDLLVELIKLVVKSLI